YITISISYISQEPTTMHYTLSLHDALPICDSDREETKKKNEKEHITWRSFWNGGSQMGPISLTWNVFGWPTLYIVDANGVIRHRSEEHTSELQSRGHLVCRLLLEKKKKA